MSNVLVVDIFGLDVLKFAFVKGSPNENLIFHLGSKDIFFLNLLGTEYSFDKSVGDNSSIYKSQKQVIIFSRFKSFNIKVSV
jgi:hypothetical protein